MATKYKIGFTRPALIRETVIVAQLYNESKNWAQVKAEISRDNMLQTRTARSSEVMLGEIQKRLSLLTDAQIELIAADFPQDVRQLVWIAICKQYPFIGDFIVEVVVPALTGGRHEIGQDDYGYFFNSKADHHHELEEVSDKTRSNARLAVFQMMRQCELLSESNQMMPQMVSSALQNSSPESDLAFIPGAIRL
ncbi:DUF1819 family protein [Alkalimarinus alittae]|uniref:DUF1819 family protein n=1 Tax=Alkalimarinus alittae TaxID=2961619 RepID=A0ABY6MXB3_9ALTE|nr:DUF1819 family protein [Alkalimarinus alittae]UZE94432.1 DUF1819 family protein [Alkalimarinus alittae]